MEQSTTRNADTTELPIIREMAELLATYKLVPFFGAGISRQHLGMAGAELAHALAVEIGESPETRLSTVSDLYAEQRGDEAFIAFLRERLLVRELDEQKVPAHRLLVSLTPSLIYTTNQDNLFELTAEKYGRKYRRVVTIEDLSEAIPGEPLLIKFHGDLDAPDSLVFGDKSYAARMVAENHPLDIKLRADLLGKRLLFLGYSLRDENVSKLLATIQKTFGGVLPPSYLLAFDDDPALAEAAEAFQIQLVVPARLYPDATSDAEAFERCLVALCNATRARQVQAGLDDLFSSKEYNRRIATDFEVDAAEAAIASGPFTTALKVFRATFDGTVVPEFLQERVVGGFRALVAMARPTDETEMGDLTGALFNLGLPPAQAMQAAAGFMAHCNQRPAANSFDRFSSLPVQAIPDGWMPAAAAMAVAMLGERGEPITSNFRQLARFWFRGWEDLPETTKENVRLTIEAAWPGALASESPINRPLFTPSGLGRGFHAIRDDLMARLPKQFQRPKE